MFCDVDANTGTPDMPASSKRACDCSWLYGPSESVASCCSEINISGSYSRSDLGDCLSDLTCVSWGLLVELYGGSLLLSLDRAALVDSVFVVSFVFSVELLEFRSLLDGLTPEIVKSLYSNTSSYVHFVCTDHRNM